LFGEIDGVYRSQKSPLDLEAIIQLKNTTEELKSRVPIKSGYRCLVCRYCTHLWDSMTAHFRKEHKGERARPKGM
jgi:hypothetical protein